MLEQIQTYKLTSKDIEILIPAKDWREAFAKFFLKIKQGEIGLDQIGCIVNLREKESQPEGKDRPFRTVPSLWLMGVIPATVAYATLEQMLDLDPKTDEAANLLISSANQDIWILDEVKRLEASQEQTGERKP